MTDYNQCIAFLVPVEHAEACNRAANALGRDGFNFGVPLSASGQEPSTHLGGSAPETEAFVSSVAAAAHFTPPAENLSSADWQAVADHLNVRAGPAATTVPIEQFTALLAEHGLQRITPLG